MGKYKYMVIVVVNLFVMNKQLIRSKKVYSFRISRLLWQGGYGGRNMMYDWLYNFCFKEQEKMNVEVQLNYVDLYKIKIFLYFEVSIGEIYIY